MVSEKLNNTEIEMVFLFFSMFKQFIGINVSKGQSVSSNSPKENAKIEFHSMLAHRHYAAVPMVIYN